MSRSDPIVRTSTSPEFMPTRICRDPVPALGLVAVARDAGQHPERGVAGAQRVVLQGDRGPEERHDAIAHHLVDDAFVRVDRLHHQLEDRIEELPGFLGIAVGQELHGALDVGEEDGHLLALTLDRSPRGEDPRGQMSRRVVAPAGEARGRAGERGDVAKRRAAHVAELAVEGGLGAAARAGAGQHRSADAAEGRRRAVAGPAPWTRHGSPGAPLARGGGGASAAGAPATLAPAHSPARWVIGRDLSGGVAHCRPGLVPGEQGRGLERLHPVALGHGHRERRGRPITGEREQRDDIVVAERGPLALLDDRGYRTGRRSRGSSPPASRRWASRRRCDRAWSRPSASPPRLPTCTRTAPGSTSVVAGVGRSSALTPSVACSW